MSLFRHKGRRVPQLHTTALPDMIFTIFATWVGSLANCEKRLAVSMKKGAPGG